MEFTPTAEQDKITTAADTGENVVVTAVAGSGKTSTLKLIGASRPATSFLYLAFGKDIQTEMQDKLPNVESRTAHSLAYGYCKDNHKHIIDRLNFKGQGYNCPIKPWKMTDAHGPPLLQELRGQRPDGRRQAQPRDQGFRAAEHGQGERHALLPHR
jgi:hypothetical protein